MNNKNVYLMDKPIDNINKDEFDHKSIVDEIINILKNNFPPYNIALIGKWGTGKSSILECVKSKLENEDKQKYLFTTINAWKYEKQEIKKAFIVEILKKLPKQNKQKNKIQEILDTLNTNYIIKKEEINIKENFFIKLFNCLKEICIVVMPLVLIYLGSFIIIDKILNFFGKTIDDYNSIRLEQTFALVLTILPIVSQIIENIMQGKNVLNFNIEENDKDTNFYEEQLNKAIELFKSKNSNFKTIVCIIEDIDRLNANKMVEAISALKGFDGINNIVFIVPYDTNILTTVLEESKINKLSNNYEILEGELILNKLFQFKIYLPELIQEDMYEYSKKLIENGNNDILTIFSNKSILIDDVLPILMYEGVTTPREAKQLINSFIAKYNIATSRNVITHEDFDIENIRKLAALTVLENDFNDFYSKILLYPNIIENFVEINEHKEVTTGDVDIYNELKSIYKKRKFELLLSFLKYISSIKMNNLERLIYLNDSKIDKVSGGKLGKEFRNALVTFDEKKASSMINKIENITEIISRELSYNSGNKLKQKNITLTLISMYSMIEDDNDKKCIRKIIEANVKIIEEKDYERISISKLMKIVVDDKEKINQNTLSILREIIDCWTPIYKDYQDQDIEINEKYILDEEIKNYIETYFDLDEMTQSKIRNLFNRIGKHSITEEEASNSFKLYTIVDLYNLLKPTLTINNYVIIKDEFLKKVVNLINKGIELEDLTILKCIYMANKEIDEFDRMLIEKYKNKQADEMLKCIEFIKNTLENINIGTKELLFNMIEDNLDVLCECNDINTIDQVLEKIVVDILKNDDTNKVDALLKKLNDKIYITNTINKIAYNNLLGKITNTLIDINNDLIYSEEDSYIKMFEKIFKRYPVEIIKDLFDKILNSIFENHIDIERIKLIINLLNFQNNKKAFKNFISEFSKYVKENFDKIGNENTRHEIIMIITDNSNLLEYSLKEEWLLFINEKLYEDDTKIAVKCELNGNFEDVDKTNWKNIIEKYVESNNIGVGEYIELLIKYVDVVKNDEDLKEKVIDKIILNFEPNNTIINYLMELDINKHEIILKVYELFTNYDNNKEIIDCMESIFINAENSKDLIKEIIDIDYDVELLIKVINIRKNELFYNAFIEIVEYYKKNIDNVELNQKIKLIKIISECFTNKKSFIYDFIEMATNIVNNIDVENVEEVLNIIINYKGNINKKDRSMLISKLEVTIEKMDDKNIMLEKLKRLK